MNFYLINSSCSTGQLATNETEDYKSAPPSPLLPNTRGFREDVITEEGDEGDADMSEGNGEEHHQGAEGDVALFVKPVAAEGDGMQ